MLHYPFLLDVASMRSSLFTNYRCFDNLYGQIGLSHDETKFPDSKFPGILVLVNQTSLQMGTSSITHRQYFHVIFHVLQLRLKTRCRYNNRAWNSKKEVTCTRFILKWGQAEYSTKGKYSTVSIKYRTSN